MKRVKYMKNNKKSLENNFERINKKNLWKKIF